MPYFGDVAEEDGVYLRSEATDESIVAQAVCSVVSLAMRIPAGSRPCIVATQMPVIPTARQTSTRENAPRDVFRDFIVFMFSGGWGFAALVSSRAWSERLHDPVDGVDLDNGGVHGVHGDHPSLGGMKGYLEAFGEGLGTGYRS